MSPRPVRHPNASAKTVPAFLLYFAAPVTPRPRQPAPLSNVEECKSPLADSVAVGALRWAAVWSEVKEEGRRRFSRRERPVNRPGGHERNTAAHRSALALTSARSTCSNAVGHQRSKGFNVGHTFASIVGCPTSATWMRSAWYCESATPAIKNGTSAALSSFATVTNIAASSSL